MPSTSLRRAPAIICEPAQRREGLLGPGELSAGRVFAGADGEETVGAPGSVSCAASVRSRARLVRVTSAHVRASSTTAMHACGPSSVPKNRRSWRPFRGGVEGTSWRSSVRRWTEPMSRHQPATHARQPDRDREAMDGCCGAGVSAVRLRRWRCRSRRPRAAGASSVRRGRRTP